MKGRKRTSRIGFVFLIAIAGASHLARVVYADEAKDMPKKARERLEKVSLPEKTDGWTLRHRVFNKAEWLALPRADVAGYLSAGYRLLSISGAKIQVVIQIHSSAKLLCHDMLGYWLTHTKHIKRRNLSGQTVCAYETYYADRGFWWPSGDTMVTVFWQGVRKPPTQLVRELLKQLPSALKKKDIQITYDQWGVREIDRRLEELGSKDPKLVALAAGHIEILAGPKEFDAKGFLNADKLTRQKTVETFRSKWKKLRKAFRHQGKVVMGFSSLWGPGRKLKPWKKNAQELRLAKLSLPKVGGGWVLRKKNLRPASQARELGGRHAKAYLRANYHAAAGTGFRQLNAAVVVYPASEFVVHDVIGRGISMSAKLSIEKRHGQLVCLVQYESGDWGMWWVSSKDPHCALVSQSVARRLPVFPEELTTLLLKEFPSTLRKEDVEISYDQWAVREIDRRIEELPSDDPKVRKRAALHISVLTRLWAWNSEFRKADKTGRRKLIEEFRAWWKDARKDFKPKGKIRY